jgi:hypothetical protein
MFNKNIKKENDYSVLQHNTKKKSNLWTDCPEVARLLKNPDNGYKFTKCCGSKTEFVCPSCGTVSKHLISNVVRRGFSCPACSDGISYPNKFMANMLNQLGVHYTSEYSFSDAKYRYDFYLTNYNIIIEMHGRQHYEKWNVSKRTLEEEQENDKNKMDHALKHNVAHYIVIDAKCSDINYISSRILSSELNNIFDMSSIDWRQCGYFASGSLVHEAAELYNKKHSVMDISNKLKHSDTTIRRWLKQATSIGLCEYIPCKGFLKNNRPVILLNTKDIVNSISEAGRKYNVSFQNISKNCKRERSYAGVSLETGDPFVWRFLDEYDPNEVVDFKSLINSHVKYTTIQN